MNRKFFRRLQENKLESLDAQLFLKLRSLKILDMSQNQLASFLPLELFQSSYHVRGEWKFIANELCRCCLYLHFPALLHACGWHYVCRRVQSIVK